MLTAFAGNDEGTSSPNDEHKESLPDFDTLRDLYLELTRTLPCKT
jgi:hypothetical protein